MKNKKNQSAVNLGRLGGTAKAKKSKKNQNVDNLGGLGETAKAKNLATGERKAGTKNRDAVKLGRLGGTARSESMTPEERAKSASAASRARWPDSPRCPCGVNTLHRARLRAFDCCKKATHNRRQIKADLKNLRGLFTWPSVPEAR